MNYLTLKLILNSCFCSKRGKERMFRLGQYLRKRYKNFLGISPLEVATRSSGSDRCLESASLILAGMYPPKSRWKWDYNLGNVWQPFPIQTVPHDNDGVSCTFQLCSLKNVHYYFLFNFIRCSIQIQIVRKASKNWKEYTIHLLYRII